MLSPRILHQETKLNKNQSQNIVDLSKYKQYKQYTRFGRYPISLTGGHNTETTLLEKIIKNRRSATSFSTDLCSLKQVETLLTLSAGVTGYDSDRHMYHKVVPSAGALNPIEVYVLILKKIESLQPGLYHYDILNNLLEKLPLKEKEEKTSLLDNLVVESEGWVKNSTLLIFHTLVFDRFEFKYGARGYRFVLIESGAMAQNAHLVGEAMGLGVRLLGGTKDEHIEEMLGIDGVTESLINTIVIGTQRK